MEGDAISGYCLQSCHFAGIDNKEFAPLNSEVMSQYTLEKALVQSSVAYCVISFSEETVFPISFASHVGMYLT